MSRFVQIAVAALFSVLSVAAAGAEGAAVVRRVAVVPGRKGLSVQIVCSRALPPRLSKLENPPRVVIDLPGAVLASPPQRISVNAQDIAEVRSSQFTQSPAVARVVVQLRVAREFSIIATGNTLALWLLPGGPANSAAGEASPAATAIQPETTPAYRPASAHPSGGAIEAAADVSTLRGASTISAGSNLAVVRLPRGGEIHVCPGTSLTVTPSQNGHDLMLALSTGTIETHYTLGSSADMVLTPDFRILLPGPGDFDFAFSADRQGNTCVRGLPGNTAAAVVSEIMGDASYQVNPNDQVLFRHGRLQNTMTGVAANCGCPLPVVPTIRAEAAPPAAAPAASSPPAAIVQRPGLAGRPSEAQNSATAAPLQKPAEGNVDVQIDAPIVYRAARQPAPPPPPPQLAQLHLASPPNDELLALTPAPPYRVKYYRLRNARRTSDKPRGFFGRIRSFFGSVFH